MENDRTFQLDATLLSQYEHIFGIDLGDVRIHTGLYANNLCKRKNADAVTVGTDIFFSQGKYAPHTEEGTKLLAHELQHVVQNLRGDRIYYYEEVMDAEQKAEKAEESITSKLLFNLEDIEGIEQNFPLATPTSPFSHISKKEDTSGSTKEQTLAKGPGGENKSDDFLNKEDIQAQATHATYQIIFRDGSSISLNKGELESMRRAFEDRINDWVRKKSYTSTEDELDTKIMKFLEMMNG